MHIWTSVVSTVVTIRSIYSTVSTRRLLTANTTCGFLRPVRTVRSTTRLFPLKVCCVIRRIKTGGVSGLRLSTVYRRRRVNSSNTVAVYVILTAVSRFCFTGIVRNKTRIRVFTLIGYLVSGLLSGARV